MGISHNDGKMEGWLYLIRSNRFGLQFSRKRFFVLKDNCLTSYKTVPVSPKEEPVRSARIDSYIRVTDNGRESIHRKVFFIFTLYNTSNHDDQLKLGASSPEEAARWILSLRDAALKECPIPEMTLVSCSKRRWRSLRLHSSKRAIHKSSIDWMYCSIMHSEAVTSDVIAPSPWKIFGCRNGLRLFKEAKDWDSRGRHWDDHPAIMAVGVVDATSEAIFHTLMSLGPSRSEWDLCYHRGSVVEHLDGHTDIIHQLLYSDCLPWGMHPRDLLLRRYWRREDDGTYVILLHSVFHKKCPQKKGYVRATLKSGGYVITPMNQGKQSMVRHMLAIDWKFWKLYVRPSSARSITISMLERLAALREMFKAKAELYSSNIPSGRVTRNMELPHSENDDMNTEIWLTEEIKKVEEEERTTYNHKGLMGMNDAADEFFDVPEPMDSDLFDNDWPAEESSKQQSPNIYYSKLPSPSDIMKKLQDLRVHRKGYMDLQEAGREDMSSFFGASLQKDTSCASPCSWATSDPSLFLIRGPSYLHDQKKIKAKGTLMQMVGADWLRSDKREDDLGSRPNSIVQRHAEQGGSEFFFIINFQIPAGAVMHTLAFYYMMKTPLKENLVLHRFVKGDDTYRNSRFKLIPYISKGSWIVKQSVGKKACLLGRSLQVNYFRGNNYFELGIDVGSSTVARGVSSLVLGYLNNLVIEMAFLIQSNTEEELPEVLLGTCRLNNLDSSKAVVVKS